LGFSLRVFLVIALSATISCSRDRSSGPKRVAIKLANVLFKSSSKDWLALAIPLVLQQDLITNTSIMPVIANGDSAVYQSNSDQFLRTTVEERPGLIRLQAELVDTPTQIVRQTIEVTGTTAAGFLPLLNAVAKRINSESITFSTNNDRALETLTAAVASSELNQRQQLLTSAVKTDPAFGLARIALIDTLAETKSGDLQTAITAASRAAPSFTKLDRLRLEALETRFSSASLPKKASAIQAVLAMAPNDTDALVTLGLTRILEGQVNEGERLLRKAAWINPASGTIRTRLAEGLLNAGKYEEAERIWSSLPNREALLPEIAVAVLLRGGKGEANAIFNRYLELRPPNDALSVLLKANWLAISGEVSQAVQLLSAGRFSDAALQSIAFNEVIVWNLMLDNWEAAKRTADRAAQVSGPFPKLPVLLASGDEDPERWRREVLNLPQASAADKQLLLAYGFFLNRHFAAAADMWEKIVNGSGDSDLQSRAMLAAALDRAGKPAEAQRLRVEPFMPDLGNLYAAVSFNEMRRLTGSLKVQ
jgi:thioredoxin-like negative regulator of GroEL